MSSQRIAVVGSRLTSPAQLGDLQLWFDCTDASTLFNATSGGSTPSVGQAVLRIEDKSSNAYHAIQGTVGLEPLRAADGLTFDGTDDRLQRTIPTGLLRNVGGATMVAVRRWASVPNTIRQVFTHSVDGTDPRALVGADATGKSRTGTRRLDSDSFSTIVSSGNVITSGFEIDTALLNFSAGTRTLFRDTTQVATASGVQGTGNTSDTPSDRFSLGSSQSGGTQHFDGTIAEFMIFHRVLEPEALRALWNYIRNKHQF
jgi:hypothetical protein